jgi:Rhodopirellula transposase DDE domain
VSGGLDHDTAACAVESMRRWWRDMGHPGYPAARRLLITADCGGSNSYRVRLWRVEWQKLADALTLTIEVCHLPSGTSKWNTIEHRMVCHITNNWRGRPVVSRQVVVNLIGNTTTATGLHIRSHLDDNSYEASIKVTDEELANVALERDKFHGEWNYRLHPRSWAKTLWMFKLFFRGS